MSQHNELFTPWQIVDGKCVVANESEWQKIEQLDKYARAAFNLWEKGKSLPEVRPVRPVVKVTTDIFEDFSGSVVNCHGTELYETKLGWMTGPFENPDLKRLELADLLTRFFQTVDSTEYVDYLIETKFPELVRSKWPYESEKIAMQLVGDPEERFVEGKRCLKVISNIIIINT